MFLVNAEPVPTCLIYQEGTSGVIESPGHPGRYPNDADCRWLVTSPDGTRIRFAFDGGVSIEEHRTCQFDWLSIEDTATGRPVGPERICGQDLPPGELVTEFNMAEVKFRSDGSVAGTGFSIDWEAEEVQGEYLYTRRAKSRDTSFLGGILINSSKPSKWWTC